MSTVISIAYLLVIAVYILVGVFIVFHMLRYKINRRVAAIMTLIYLIGGIILLISNISLFFSVNWYQIINNFNF
jgi:hypothetical protein